MTRHSVERSVVGIALAWIVAAGAGRLSAQGVPPRGTGPAPGQRFITSMADCDALQREWDAYKSQLNAQHEACLKANENSKARTIGDCSRAPCQQLHTLLYRTVPAESSAILKDCRAQASEIERQKQLARQQQAANEEAIRRYNEQRRQAMLQFAEDQRRYQQQLQERDRQERAAVLRRNQEIQRQYEEYMRRAQESRQAVSEQVQRAYDAVRESLKNTSDVLSNRVSNLFDSVGSTTIDDAVDNARTATSRFSDAFSLYSAVQQIDPPERIETVSQFTENAGALWNIFRGLWQGSSATATPDERFDSQMKVLSNSTTFLFRTTPGVGEIVSNRIEGIQRWSHSTMGYLDSALSRGEIPSDEQIKEDFVRDNFPGFAWLNDKVKSFDETKEKIYQFFGR